MPRASRGSARLRRGTWFARVTVDAGKRIELTLPTCGPADDDKAQERAQVLGELAARLRAAGHAELAPRLLERAAARDGRALEDVLEAGERLCSGAARVGPHARLTVAEFGEEWTSGQLHARFPDHVKLKKTADDDRERLEKYVYPLIGDVPLVAVTVDHAHRVMAQLPRRLAQSTRRHVAQVLSRLLKLAAYPAQILDRSPLPPGFVPPPGQRKALTYLYPDEDRQLLGCEAVPLEHRVFYGFTSREGMRSGEAQRLTWSDVDLERGALKLDKNKTDQPRSWALDPGVARALAAWRRRRGNPADDELVFCDAAGAPIGEDTRAAQRLRSDLVTAGVKRPELFEKSAARVRVRVHDLRATMITVALANGRTETWVADRTGHKSSAMINRYRRAARLFDELGLGDLAPLDEAIPELVPEVGAAAASEGPEGRSGGSSGGSGSERRSGGSVSPCDSRGRTRTGTPLREADFEAPSEAPTGADMRDPAEIRASDPPDRSGGPALPPLPGGLPPLRESSDPAPRARMIGELCASLAAAAGAGDLAAARVAHDALGRLLEHVDGDAAEVVDLADRRRKGDR